MQNKNNFGKNGKSNCDLKEIYGINYVFTNLHAFMIFSAAKAYKNPQKNARQVFSVNLSSIFLVYKLINSKRNDTQYIKTNDNHYTNLVHERNVLKNVVSF